MITSMHIENFKCFKNFDIELGPFNVLIGPNDSGKTAFLQAIQLVDRVSDMSITNPVSVDEIKGPAIEKIGAGPIENWLRQKDQKINIGMNVKISPRDQKDCCGAFFDIKNGMIAGSSKIEPLPGSLLGSLPAGKRGSNQDLKNTAVGLIDYLHFDPAALRRPTPPESALFPNGEGLPALVEEIRGNIEHFKKFQDEFCLRFPYYKTINRVFDSQSRVNLIFDTKDDNKIPAIGVSDGVMLSMAFLALKYARKEPGHHIYLIEEPENGVHPGALKEIRDTLHHLSQQKGIQIILTTHSPYLLDLVEPEEVRVFQKDDEGAVHAVKLSDFPDVAEMRKHFGAGEIWTAFDEKKIVETVRGEK